MNQIILYLLFVAPAAPIYQCEGLRGEPYFSDRYCPKGQRIKTQTISIIEHAALTKEETEQLARLKPPRSTKPRRLRKSARDRQVDVTCHSTRQNLRDLREKRRKGYNVKDSNELEQQERQLKKERRRLC